ncbi:urokinase plasminogen activator surface receptor-like [Xyrauchen texanus]|uniref:urokinase plasminogen activator surface receptor-like n=1 Tax=Xyrauchen texanus TaxID=154827 RepID=UPI0022421A4F|nr:urokinase plasminogen activator surface receptor-like [Xyrauchen texanus]
MALYIPLIFFSALFSKALTLTCYTCIPDISGKCTQTQTTCQSRCGSLTTTVYLNGTKLNSSRMKTCADPISCINGSMNYGSGRVTFNTQCCSVDLCNSNFAPDLSQQPLNGKKCYTCADKNCSKTLPCEGTEDQCFTSTVVIDGNKVIQKGCSSKFFCGNNASRTLGRSDGYDMRCCDGNLCNSGQSMSVFFLLLVPLLFLHLL